MAVQIDHVVSLSDAWQTGAQALDAATREALATDLANLQATDGPTNERKGDGDAASWLPVAAYRCAYVSRQVGVKTAYHLWVTPGGARRHGRGAGGRGVRVSLDDVQRWAAELQQQLDDACDEQSARPIADDLHALMDSVGNVHELHDSR